MIRTTSNRIISVLLVFCMVLSFAAYSEEAFDMKLLIDNVLTIHSRPVKIKENEWDLTSLFKGTLAEKKEIENKCKQQIAAMMTNIAETSDVAVLKPLLEDAWVFYHCIRDIVAEQEKLPPELNHKIMDFIIRNGTETVKEGWSTASVYYGRELLDRHLPEAHLSSAFLEYATELLFSQKLHFWYYFELPKSTRQKLHPKLRDLSKSLVPDGEHTRRAMEISLPATACLAFDGDEDAITKLCLYLDHMTTSNFDLWDAITICALSKQRKVIDKIIHIMKTDMREQVLGLDVIPNVTGPRRAAASALSKIDKNFPSYTYKALDMRHDSEMDACLEWLKTHEIDLKQPLYPQKINLRIFFN
ncbi:MAG: hypothetical protein IKS92_07645 [Victivallales bacterium]|nr:hypothetical protein [Victivallales bacterium]